MQIFLNKLDPHLMSSILLDSTCEQVKIFEGLGKAFTCAASVQENNTEELKESIYESLKTDKF